MQNEKLPAILTHVTGPTVVGPLVLYFIFRNRASPWLREHLDEALNYWILVLVSAILLITAAVLIPPSFALWVAILALVIVLTALLFLVISVVKASMGKASHYPLNIKMIK